MAAAAQGWLDSLTPDLRRQAAFDVAGDERDNWHYIPKPRQGVPLKQMDERQRHLARALLESGLSQHGLIQADAVMALERVLRAMEHSDHRDEELYYFTVFGTPGAAGPWGWRVEGHHLSVNFTLAGDHISATPNFVGSNPAEVRLPGPQLGARALAEEEDLGRALARSLDADQRRTGILSIPAPGDILTRNEKQVGPLEPRGLGYAAMTPAQQDQLKALVALYASRLRPELAGAELKKIADSGWNHVSFAWAGGFEPGQGHYYRIENDEFVIEFDNTQNHANHIHTVWRSFQGDFGRDLLREHYQASHAGSAGP
jgi:hypothetical protein